MPQAMIMPKKYFFDKDGNPLAYGKVYTYQTGTTINKETFTKESGGVPNTNPVILNGEGYASIYLNGSYNIVVDDQNDNNIWTEDPVSSNIAEEWVNCEVPTYLTPTSFKINGNVTAQYEGGRRVRIDNNTANFDYATILTSSFSAGETTIQVDDSVVAAGIVGVCTSVVSSNSNPGLSDFSFQNLTDARNSSLAKSGTTVSVKYIKNLNNETTSIFDVVDAIPEDINNGIYSGIKDTGVSFVLRNKGVLKSNTIAQAKNRADVKLGSVVSVTETNGTYNVVLQSGVAENPFYIFDNVEIPTLAISLRQGNVVLLDSYLQSDGVEQAAVDYLEGLLFPGGRIVAEQPRSFTGVVQGDLISWEGVGGRVTEFTNSVAGSTMIDLNYVGVSDVDKRNFIQFKNIRFNDEASGTGIGIHSNLFFFIDLSRCFFSGFTSGYGADIEEALWVQLNNVNTDSSNIRLRSLLDPHFNNVIEINGGEFRNPTTFALEVDTCDILRFNGLTIEGDLSNTTTPTRPVSIKNANMVTGRLYMEFLRTGDSGIKMDNVKFSSLDHSLLNTNNDSVPAVWLHDCANITISKSKFATGLKTTGNIANVLVKECGVRGLMDILPGHDVSFDDCSPLDTSGAIPVDPQLQSEMFSGAGIPMKNWYLSSSFAERDPTLDTSGTATISYDQTEGYHDLNSLKVVAVGAQTCVFSNMGTTDNINDGAIITFMAKANINTQVNLQGSISATLGTAFCKFTTEWKRFFVFTQLSVAAAGTGINAIFTTTETCEFNIDDIQTLAYQSFEEAGTLFSNFRHVPTHGARITVKEQRNVEIRKLNFDRGMNLRKTAIAPVSPVEGDIHLADGVNWNPKSLSVGAYFVWWQGGAWVGLNQGASGGAIS